MPLLDEETRARVWARVQDEAERYVRGVGELRVAPELDPAAMRALLAPFDFAVPAGAEEMVGWVAENLRRHQVHASHPMYFGRFNPAPASMGIAADALAAAFNPQLAAWSYSPFAVEVERHLLRAFGARFGYAPERVDGTFTVGSAEGNLTAVLAALASRFPEAAHGGVRALPGDPVLYASAEGHHSVQKAARAAGLGLDAVRAVPVDGRLKMVPAALAERVRADRAEGRLPFLVVATAGSTSAGAVDPIAAVADVAAAEGLWLHVDAAWGGAAVLLPERRHLLDGVERADSLTFDAHKWLSVPMGAGLFITRHPGVLGRAFATTTEYMPVEAAALDVADPYAHSLQWSRRFIGLKLFLTLAVAGWDGTAAVLRRHVELADLLAARLRGDGWEVVNDPSLAVVCFVGSHPGGASARFLASVVRRVVQGGRALVALTRVGGQAAPVIRACVTNFRSTEDDVERLVRLLGEARAAVAAEGAAGEAGDGG